MRRFCIIFFVILLIVSCSKKKEEAPQGFNGGTPMPQPQMGIKMGKSQVVIPEDVNKVWKSVNIEVLNKESNESKKFDIDIGKELTIPNSNIKLKVESFLPSLTIIGNTITSSSNEPKNPAARILIIENDKEIFHGWLYQRFQMIHPFQHPKYKVTLVGYSKR